MTRCRGRIGAALGETVRAWLVLLVVVGLSVPAGAHPKAYVNLTGDVTMVPNDCDGSIGVSQGGVCFPGGHIVPDLQGRATLTVGDATAVPVSGCYQQPVGSAPLCRPFCGSITIDRHVDWDPSENVEIFIDGPVQGSPAYSACGITVSMGTTGHVYHS